MGVVSVEETRITIVGVPLVRAAAALEELRRHLVKNEVRASFSQSSTVEGARADGTLLAELAIGLVSGGALVAVVDCVKSLLTRDSKMSIEVQEEGGRLVKITAENVKQAEILATFESIVRRLPVD